MLGAAVMAFARDSGELASLSGVDMKLIALAHTLEVAVSRVLPSEGICGNVAAPCLIYLWEANRANDRLLATMLD